MSSFTHRLDECTLGKAMQRSVKNAGPKLRNSLGTPSKVRSCIPTKPMGWAARPMALSPGYPMALSLGYPPLLEHNGAANECMNREKGKYRGEDLRHFTRMMPEAWAFRRVQDHLVLPTWRAFLSRPHSSVQNGDTERTHACRGMGLRRW